MPSREKVAALHIGVHKTGTSVVQQYLRENQWDLRRRRILPVRRAEIGSYVGWGATLLADPRPFAARIARFRRSPVFTTLFGSYENLVGRPFVRGGDGRLYPDAPANIEALAGVLRPGRCKIFLSIRPQHDFLESYYLQTIHQGAHHTFDQWLAGVDLEAVSWRPLIEALHRHFSRDEIEIVDFRLITAGQEAYLAHFFSRIDPSLNLRIRHPAPRNRSLSARGLAMALDANPHLRTGPERSTLRRFLQAHFSNLDFPRPVLFSEEQKASLRERYSAEYEELVGRAAPSEPVDR